MLTQNNVSAQIARLISKNASFLPHNGLSGKLGMCVFLYKHGRASRKNHYSSLAFDLLDYSINKELLLNISKSDISFITGVSGIGVFMMHLVNEKYVDTEIEEILEIIDKRVYSEIEYLTRTSEPSLLTNLFSVLSYLIFRRAGSLFDREYDKLLNEEAVLVSKIAILNLIGLEGNLKKLNLFSLIVKDLYRFGADPYFTDIEKQLTEKICLAADQKKRSPKYLSKLEFKIYNSLEKNQLLNENKRQKILSEILLNQSDLLQTFRNLVLLGLEVLNEQSAAMNLFWNFSHLDFLERHSEKKIGTYLSGKEFK